MATVNLFATMNNIVTELARQRDAFAALEQMEATGKVIAGGETVEIPPSQLSALKVKLNGERGRVTGLANSLNVPVVYL